MYNEQINHKYFYLFFSFFTKVVKTVVSISRCWNHYSWNSIYGPQNIVNFPFRAAPKVFHFEIVKTTGNCFVQRLATTNTFTGCHFCHFTVTDIIYCCLLCQWQLYCEKHTRTLFFVIFGATDTPVFGLLVTSALGFKAMMDPSHTWILACSKWIPQIELWCDTCWHVCFTANNPLQFDDVFFRRHNKESCCP